jgi:probable phosphomutase (TIGR03848 family)
MSSATTFILVRHASYGLLDHRLGGRAPGHSLNEQGRAEAARLAAALAGAPLAAIVASPMERTQETAAAIAARHGLAVQTDEDLIEMDFGAWTGADFRSLHDDPVWRAFNSFRATAPIPGGETMLAVQARMIAALRRLQAAHRDRMIAVVSHADPIKSVLTHFLGMPLDLMRRIEVAPASRSVLTLYDEDAVVTAINLPPG